MITDNLPNEFSYISGRLVTDITRRWVAGRSSIQVGELGLGFGFVHATIKVAEIDWHNPYQLARIATFAVSDNTGWIDANDPRGRVPTGCYVRARMYMQHSLVTVLGWEDGRARQLAAFAGWETLPQFGRVFVALMGSRANLLSVQRQPSLTKSGRTASDMYGLYELIRATREFDEPDIREIELELEHSLTRESSSLIVAAVESLHASHLMGNAELVDTLFRVHESATQFESGLKTPENQEIGKFDLGILGAPIWIGRPLPAVDKRMLRSGRHAYQAMSHTDVGDGERFTFSVQVASKTRYADTPAWLRHSVPLAAADIGCVDVEAPGLNGTAGWDLFDSWTTSYIDVWQGRSRSAILNDWPPTDDRWADFCLWAVDMALRFGPMVWPIAEPLQRKRERRFSRRAKWQAKGQVGWLTVPEYGLPMQPRSGDQFMLLTTGSVYRCFTNGVARDINPVQSAFAAAPAAAILRSAARWMTPLSPSYESDPFIDRRGRVSFVSPESPNDIQPVNPAV